MGTDYDELVEEAERVPPGSEGLVFPPYLIGERTLHLDSAARRAFVCMTARHARAYMPRSLMEDLVFSLRDSL